MQPNRPVSATIFGILNIFFAIMGLFSLLIVKLLHNFQANMPHRAGSPTLHMLDNPSYQNLMHISTWMQVGVAPFLLAAGIGLLLLKNWGRIMSIVYGIYAILSGLIMSWLTVSMVFLPLLNNGGNGPEKFAGMAGAIGGVIGGLFSLIYPILLIVFMTRPKLITAFQPVPAPSPSLSQP